MRVLQDDEDFLVEVIDSAKGWEYRRRAAKLLELVLKEDLRQLHQ